MATEQIYAGEHAMNTYQSLSPVSRMLMAVTAIAFGLMGLILFLVPAWSAANFSWKITPLVAMTMGGWYLGSAAMASLVAYYRRWNLVYISALYVGVFSLSEAVVLVIHRASLRLDALLAWPYIGMLALAILASLFVLADWLRHQPMIAAGGAPAPAWVRVVILIFILFVFFLAAVAFSGRPVGLDGEIFPEPLSLFTLRSFGAFYFSLAFSVLPLLRVQRLSAVTVHVKGGIILILLITVAALVYISSFNFVQHPLQSIYLGVYIVAFFLALFYLVREDRWA
jgi:hypothetical protein